MTADKHDNIAFRRRTEPDVVTQAHTALKRKQAEYNEARNALKEAGAVEAVVSAAVTLLIAWRVGLLAAIVIGWILIEGIRALNSAYYRCDIRVDNTPLARAQRLYDDPKEQANRDMFEYLRTSLVHARWRFWPLKDDAGTLKTLRMLPKQDGEDMVRVLCVQALYHAQE